MDLIKRPVSWSLPASELSRAGAPRGIKAAAFYGKELRDGCIAQVDFLGFVNLLHRAQGRGAEVVHDFYQQTELHARIGARTNGDDQEPTIALFQYADTINIVARDNGPLGIRPVVLATATLLASAHGRGLPARAGISMGEVWAVSHQEQGGLGGDFVSGPALAAAHTVETAQDWAGAVLDPKSKSLIPTKQVKELVDEGWLVEADVPLKIAAGNVEVRRSLAVNWPRALHVPNLHWLASVLRVDNPPNKGEEGQWRKRRLAFEFYERHGRGRLPEHEDDYTAWLLSPSGLHLPLVPSITLTL